MTENKIIPDEAKPLSQLEMPKDYYKRHLEVICNNATLAIFIMDERQQCVYMNPAAEKLTGFSLDEIKGRALHDMIHHTRPDGNPYPLEDCPIDRAFPQNNQEQGEEVFVHKNGSFYPVAYTASPIREDGGIVGTIVEVRDITQEKSDQKARQELEEARTAFFSNVSHEFRTPLTLILGSLEEILANSRISQGDRPQVEMAHHNSLRLLQLVNTLLDFSRIEAGRTQAVYEPTDLAAFTTELASTFRSVVERADMRLIVDCPPLPELVYVDHALWEKIVFNLLSNAFKFTLAGEICVSLRLVAGESAKGDPQNNSMLSHCVELTVQDTGVGIPADELPRLFDRFHRVKEVQGRSYEGSGIGLSLVQELVKLHGGTIDVTSVVGEGSCFTVSIPTGYAHLPQDCVSTICKATVYVDQGRGARGEGREEGVEQGREARGARREEDLEQGREEDIAISPSGVRILLVDDSADMRNYVKRLLNRYTVETAANGIVALDAIAQNPPELVLTDVMMPGIDGFELLRKLRADPKTSAIPVILLSARAGEESRVEGLEAGADDYLVKPFSTRELLARVEANLNMAQLRREAAQREHQLRITAEIASDRLETVLASINDVFMVFDRNWYYTYVNQKTVETSGIRREEFLSKTLWDVFPDLVGTEFYDKLHYAVATKTPVQFEYYYAVWDRWFENRVYPSADGASMFVTEITDRKRALAALTESEARFRQMAETIQDVFWLWNPQEKRPLYISPAYERIWGQSCESLYDDFNQWIETVYPDDREQIQTAMRRCLDIGYLDQEYRIVRPDGSICWIRDRGFVLYDNNEPDRVAGVAQDITDRKQTEAALQQSEAQFRQLANAMPQIVWIANASGEPEYVNQQWVEYTGLSLSQTSDQSNIFQTIHPDDIAATYKIWESCLASGLVYQTEFRLKRADDDDTYRWFLCRAVPIRDDQAQTVRWYGTLTDIDDRKRAERDREEFFVRQQQYAQQLQGLTKAALAINTARSIKDVLDVITEQAYRIVGTHQAITSMTIDRNWSQAINAIHLSDKYAQWREYDKMPDGSGIYALVCQMNRPIRMTQVQLESHPRWQNFGKEAINHPPMRGWLAAPLVGRDGNNIGLIQLSDKYEGDFTEEDEAILVQLAQMASVAVENARLYEAEQQAREEAETANRIKDEFLAVLSHELRSPLNPILGWVKLLQSRKFDAQATAKALETIERNAKLQTQLIEDLLDVSRILRGKMVFNVNPVNLVTTIEAALETVRLAAAAKNIQIQTMFDINAVLSGDASRLQQVIWNLLSNAVKFTPAGGRIEVQLQLMGADALIQVKDTGKGINPEFLPYVFDYFRQEDGKTTRKFGGLGLGLAIVRQITELHGGTVKADSPGEGHGAIFTVQLPLLQQQSQHDDRELVHPSSFVPNRLQGMRVLIVDDEVDMRELVLVILEQYGAEVSVAASAAEALAFLDHFQPNILISDIGMPDVDGYMLMRQVRARSQNLGGQIPAIALTAYAGEFDQQQALAVGFQHHLPKPVEPERLVQAIADLIK